MTWRDAQPQLPEGWAWTTVGEVADVDLGKMLDRKKENGKHLVKYLRNINVRWHSLDLGDLLSMEVAPETRDRYGVRAGDLLVCEGGEPGRCAVVPAAADGLAYQKALHRIRPADGVHVQYLAYGLEAMAGSGSLAEHLTGSTIKHLPRERLIDLPLPLAPTDEQRRIVDALGSLRSGTDAASRQLDQLERSMAALRNSVLRAFLAGDGEPTMTIGEVADLGSGATPSKGDAGYYSGGEIPWLTSGDLNTRVLTKARLFITERAVSETAVRLWPRGTLLVAMYGEGQTRGRAARLDFPSTTNQACAAIHLKPDAPVSVNFLHGFFDATYHRNRLLSAGGVQPNLSLKVIRGISFPVRPSKEQDALVARYESFLEQQNSVLNALATLRARLLAFDRRTFSHAFAGQLVGQVTSDEPAELLLKSIAAERDARASAERTRKRTIAKTRTPRVPMNQETTA